MKIVQAVLLVIIIVISAIIGCLIGAIFGLFVGPAQVMSWLNTEGTTKTSDTI